MKLQGNSILILPDENPEKTEKGILIPKTVKNNQLIGTVIAKGPECEIARIGDHVIYSKGGSVINYNNNEHHSITEDKLLYIYHSHVEAE